MNPSSLANEPKKTGLSQEAVLRALLANRTTLLGYIWSMVRDRHVVEDIFQEVSVLALEKREEFGDERALPTWLRRTAPIPRVGLFSKCPANASDAQCLDHGFDGPKLGEGG